MQKIFEQDQADRQHSGRVDWTQVGPRDTARRQRVVQLLRSGAAKTAEDFYRAAMIFQHGDSVEDYRNARKLALRAVELRPTYREARWLAAAALDRELVRTGKPQKYGTQYRQIDGLWKLYDVDPATTDGERTLWGVEPLEDARRFEAELNRKERP